MLEEESRAVNHPRLSTINADGKVIRTLFQEVPAVELHPGATRAVPLVRVLTGAPEVRPGATPIPTPTPVGGAATTPEVPLAAAGVDSPAAIPVVVFQVEAGVEEGDTNRLSADNLRLFL